LEGFRKVSERSRPSLRNLSLSQDARNVDFLRKFAISGLTLPFCIHHLILLSCPLLETGVLRVLIYVYNNIYRNIYIKIYIYKDIYTNIYLKLHTPNLVTPIGHLTWIRLGYRIGRVREKTRENREIAKDSGDSGPPA